MTSKKWPPPPPKIEIAPQEKQKQIESIQDIFLIKILGIQGALITDESCLSDFISYPGDKAVRPGSTPGKMIFVKKMYVGPKVNMFEDHSRWKIEIRKPENWEEREIEANPEPSKSDIIEKTLEVFGVDITEYYDQPLVDILYFIAMNYKGKENL